MREQNWLKTWEEHETVVESVWDWQFGKFFASPTNFLFFSLPPADLALNPPF